MCARFSIAYSVFWIRWYQYCGHSNITYRRAVGLMYFSCANRTALALSRVESIYIYIYEIFFYFFYSWCFVCCSSMLITRIWRPTERICVYKRIAHAIIRWLYINLHKSWLCRSIHNTGARSHFIQQTSTLWGGLYYWYWGALCGAWV